MSLTLLSSICLVFNFLHIHWIPSTALTALLYPLCLSVFVPFCCVATSSEKQTNKQHQKQKKNSFTLQGSTSRLKMLWRWDILFCRKAHEAQEYRTQKFKRYLKVTRYTKWLPLFLEDRSSWNCWWILSEKPSCPEDSKTIQHTVKR